jgi:hypothetical protein
MYTYIQPEVKNWTNEHAVYTHTSSAACLLGFCFSFITRFRNLNLLTDYKGSNFTYMYIIYISRFVRSHVRFVFCGWCWYSIGYSIVTEFSIKIRIHIRQNVLFFFFFFRLSYIIHMYIMCTLALLLLSYTHVLGWHGLRI